MPTAEQDESRETALAAAQAGLDKKAENVAVIEVRGLTSFADYLVVMSGSSDRQVAAIAEAITDRLRGLGRRPFGVEGEAQGHWVLADYGDVVVHVFYGDLRAFYDVEGLWADAPRVPVEA